MAASSIARWTGDTNPRNRTASSDTELAGIRLERRLERAAARTSRARRERGREAWASARRRTR
jgi:hypothetical protein